MRIRRPLAALALVALTFAGCASSGSSPSAASSSAASPSAVITAAPGGVTICYEENSQLELIAPSGRRVIVDVWDPSLLSSPPTSSDILLTTHLHEYHYVAGFVDSFPGRKLTNEAGRIELDDVTVTGIDATHSGGPIVPGAATDHIFIVDMGGIRIVHVGHLGAPALTDGQLAAMGKVDVAIWTFRDVSGPWDWGTGFNDYQLGHATRVAPRVLIPTDIDLDQVKRAAAQWDATFTARPCVTIRPDDLPAETTLLFMGSLAPSIGSVLHLTEADW